MAKVKAFLVAAKAFVVAHPKLSLGVAAYLAGVVTGLVL